jgi:hypothetical protein
MNLIYNSFVKNFIHSCPPQFYESIFTQIMTPLLGLTISRLDKGWGNIIMINNGLKNSSIDNEVIYERWTRDFTKDLIDIFFELVKNLTVTKTNAYPKITNLAKFILNSTVGEQLMLLISSFLNYPDTYSCQKAICFIKNIYPFLTEKYDSK